MELMEQQLVRCGVPPVRLYEHLAMSSPSAAVAAALHHQQQQQTSPVSPQQQQQQSWLAAPSAALLYAAAARGAAAAAVGAVPPPSSYPYQGAAAPWPWQPTPASITARRASPPGGRFASYPHAPPSSSGGSTPSPPLHRPQPRSPTTPN